MVHTVLPRKDEKNQIFRSAFRTTPCVGLPFPEVNFQYTMIPAGPDSNSQSTAWKLQTVTREPQGLQCFLLTYCLACCNCMNMVRVPGGNKLMQSPFHVSGFTAPWAACMENFPWVGPQCAGFWGDSLVWSHRE